jgi:hypothetical protein
MLSWFLSNTALFYGQILAVGEGDEKREQPGGDQHGGDHVAVQGERLGGCN